MFLVPKDILATSVILKALTTGGRVDGWIGGPSLGEAEHSPPTAPCVRDWLLRVKEVS